MLLLALVLLNSDGAAVIEHKKGKKGLLSARILMGGWGD